jgi:hypothetical protein
METFIPWPFLSFDGGECLHALENALSIDSIRRHAGGISSLTEICELCPSDGFRKTKEPGSTA